MSTLAINANVQLALQGTASGFNQNQAAIDAFAAAIEDLFSDELDATVSDVVATRETKSTNLLHEKSRDIVKSR